MSKFTALAIELITVISVAPQSQTIKNKGIDLYLFQKLNPAKAE